MFGIFNLTRADEMRGKEKQNENNDEPCYGGLSNRLDYEYTKNRKNRASTFLLYLAVFLFVGVTASAAGIVAYDFIQENRLLYFPGAEELDEYPERTGFSRAAAQLDDITLVAVSSDQSVRYRIPRGVMVKMINSTAKKYENFFAGDIIVAVNGTEIVSVDELRENYSDTEPAVFRVFRQNRYIDVPVDGTESEE